MTPALRAAPGNAIADSIRRQLGTDTVVLITVGQSYCSVVIAPEADDPPSRASAQPEPTDMAGSRHGDRLAYSVAEAATALGVSRDILYDQLRTGRLGSLKVGRRRIITREHIDQFLAGLTQEK